MKYQLKVHLSISFAVLLFTNNAAAQPGFLAPVQAKLEEYNQKLSPEKLYVHTDKGFYTSGETIFFKLYALDGLTNLPSHSSKVAYLELLDANNKMVVQAKIAMAEKGGDGHLEIPIGINSGYYTLRAYTAAMKNLGAEYFFTKTVTVVNPLKDPEEDPENSIPSYELDLFPEGGNLVNGIQSRVAFRAIGPDGKGLDGTGYLVNQLDDTLSVFEPFKFGMGSFDIVPVAGQPYKVVFVLNDGKFIARPLPQVQDKGYVMTVEDVENDRVQISVHTNIRSGYPEIFFLAQSQQVARSVKRAVISDGMARFLVDRSDLGEGVIQFTIFDNEQQPVTERLYFIAPAKKTTASISAGKNEYAKRDLVSLSLDMPSLLNGNLSMAVFKSDSLQAADKNDIVAFTWLSSELKGDIEQPSFYFSSSPGVQKAADLLMMTHGWRRFTWEKILNNQPVVSFPLENTGHLVSARVTDKKTGEPAARVQAFLSIPGSSYKLYSALSDENGIARFDVKDFYGPGELILQTNFKRDSIYNLELLSPYSEVYTSVKYPGFKLSPSQKEDLEAHSISMQAQHIYFSDSVRRFQLPQASDTFSFYGRPMYSYNLDDYKRFGTMEEVLREYVREVNVGVKGAGSSLRFKLFNENDRDYYTDDILVLVDGVPLFNPNQVFDYDPTKIKSLDVITRNYVLGSSVFHALASFHSYQQNFEGFEPAPQAVKIDYEGLQLQRRFYVPDYGNAALRNSRLPDLRNTLFWMPYVDNEQINFYTGDNEGRYLVVIQGLDANGRPVSSYSEFRVK